jgi:hypothetical protein
VQWDFWVGEHHQQLRLVVLGAGNEFIEGMIASLGGKKAVKLMFQENRFFRVWLLAIIAQAVIEIPERPEEFIA